MRCGGIGKIENFNDLGTFLAKGRRFESQISNNIFFVFRFFLNTQFYAVCGKKQILLILKYLGVI